MLNTIDEIKERLITFYDPNSIILYGSQASGKATEISDIDLLITKDTKERPIDRRIHVERILLDRAVPLDIVVYTPAEIKYLFSIGSPFIEEIIKTGRVLYMRKNIDDAVFLNSIYKGRYPTEEGLLPHGEPANVDAENATKAAKLFMEGIKR
ncbi:MAG: nucleotidyltransferase domain-containing protein [Spirochaetota bacterium]